MALKINDPRVIEWNAKTKEKYRLRAMDALIAEQITPDETLLDLIAVAGWKHELGSSPNLWNDGLLRIARDGIDATTNEFKRINAAGSKLAGLIDGASRGTRNTLLRDLEARGISAEQLEEMLYALLDIADSRSCNTRDSSRTGNTTKLQSEFVLFLWPHLEEAGASLKSAGRIISSVLYDNNDQADTIYQAIRNSVTR